MVRARRSTIRWVLNRMVLSWALLIIIPEIVAEELEINTSTEANHLYSSAAEADVLVLEDEKVPELEIISEDTQILTEYPQELQRFNQMILASTSTKASGSEGSPPLCHVDPGAGRTGTPSEKKPTCEEGRGCDPPLNCFNFRTLGNASVVPDPPRAVKVTPYQLEGILENPSTANCCAVVMFYAPWCEFSAQFARKFNALGRTFDGLPTLAVDLGENEPHKYVLAYLPVVAFYYRGRLMLKFKLSTTYEELRDTITNMTGFAPRDAALDLEDEANKLPVPTEREDGDRLPLQLTVWWLVFVALVLALKSRTAIEYMQRIRTKLGWLKTEKVE